MNLSEIFIRRPVMTVLLNAAIIVAGLIIYLVRSYKRGEYPFGSNVIGNEA
mgnify:CR=1 FL=1